MTDAKTIDVSTETVRDFVYGLRDIASDYCADMLAAVAADRDRLATQLAAALKRAEEAERDGLRGEKRAPVQGYRAGIPWSMHLRAYDAYCKKWGKQEALVDLEGRNCRGGFGVSELDNFIPGWKEELSEISKLRADLTTAHATIAKLKAESDLHKADVDLVAKSFALLAVDWFADNGPNSEILLAEAFKRRLNQLLHPRASGYNPDMVTKLLDADVNPAAARFDDVVSMLDWLDRDYEWESLSRPSEPTK